MKFKPIDTYPKVAGEIPNELVLLLMEATGNEQTCLIDAVPGDRYVTIGNWTPGEPDTYHKTGFWNYVGWNWEMDSLVECSQEDGLQLSDKVIGWMPLPNVDLEIE